MFMQVLSPSTSLWDQQTLFVVQRPGTRPAARHWSPLTDEGWTLVFPQWETPADLRELFDDCHRKRGLDPERIVITGVEAGGSYALALAQETGRVCMTVSAEEALDVIAQRARKTLYG